MSKIISIFMIVLCCFSLGFCFVSSKKNVYAERKLNILAFGDSISAGYAPNTSPYSDTEETEDQVVLQKRQMLENYKSYYNSAYGTSISKSCFTHLFSKLLQNDENVKSYANSGDTSSDLVDILTIDNFQKRLAETDQVVTLSNQQILSEIKNANIITLCIGANDVLRPAIAKLENIDFLKLITELSTEERQEFEDLIENGVNTFKENYENVILPTLNQGAQIYVMTIYNPYQYLGIAENFAGLKQLMTIAMNGISEINNFIKSKEEGKITVIDVADEFSKISQKDYKNYVNVDMSKLTSIELSTLQEQLERGEMPYFLDPHPTPLGQQKIAEMYAERYTKNNTVPITTKVFTGLAISFFAILVGYGTYFVIQKVKYRAIKF